MVYLYIKVRQHNYHSLYPADSIAVLRKISSMNSDMLITWEITCEGSCTAFNFESCSAVRLQVWGVLCDTGMPGYISQIEVYMCVFIYTHINVCTYTYVPVRYTYHGTPIFHKITYINVNLWEMYHSICTYRYILYRHTLRYTRVHTRSGTQNPQAGCSSTVHLTPPEHLFP